ncbi:hypothetical protein Tco_0391886, partial [Tanacetum coccineum]
KRKERSCDVIKLKIEDGVKIIKDLFKEEDKKEIEEKRFWHHDIREELLDRVMSSLYMKKVPYDCHMATWLTYMLYNLPDIGIREAAVKALFGNRRS